MENALQPRALPQSIDETLDLLTGADYVADRALATVLFLIVAGLAALVVPFTNRQVA